MAILLYQHIATKNAMLNVLKAKYDYSEKVAVGDVIHMQENVTVEKTSNDEAVAELAALKAERDRLAKVAEAAREMCSSPYEMLDHRGRVLVDRREYMALYAAVAKLNKGE